MTPDERLAELERDVRRHLAGLRADLCEAYDRRDWKALGHASWEAYLAAEYGDFAEDAARIVAEARR